MTTISCPNADQLVDMLHEALPPQEQAAARAHVDACAACQRTIEDLIHASSADALHFRGLDEQPEPGGDAGSEPAKETQTIALDISGNARAQSDASDDGSLDFFSPPDDPGHLGKLGHYEILSVVGRGGLGVVLKGYDTRLKRIVAIKAPLREFAANAAARKRFSREAEAAAAVSHDHVVTIHAVEPDNYPYLVMEYVDGISLQDKLDGSGPLELKEILRIGMQTARGLAAAHEQGLIHRDIKPANILLENGVQRVKITDFGLARAVDDMSVTQTGVIAGTPQFMSPEQANGTLVDHRSDLFSLGCTLYATCTGRSPFRAETTMAVLKRVCDDTPKPIRKINPAIPEWLAEIVDKLLEKKPEHRFQSAREVADLLSQHLAHLQQPEANPPPARLRAGGHHSGRLRKAVLLFGGLLFIGFTGLWFTPAEPFRFGPKMPTIVTKSERTAGGPRPDKVLQGGDGPIVADREVPPPSSPRPVEILRPDRVLLSALGHTDAHVHLVAFTKDGGRALTGEFAGRVELWDVAKGIPRFTLTGHSESVHAIAISPDQRLVATGGEDSIIRLWALDTAEPVKEIPGHTGWVMSLAFRNGGKELVSLGWDFKKFEDHTIRLWDVESGKEHWRISDGLQFPVDMALAPDGSWAAVGDVNFRRVGLWDIETQSPRHFFEGFAAGPISVAVSHNGALVAAGYNAEQQVDGKWNDPVSTVARLWDAESGRLLHELRGHSGPVLSVQFSPDDRYLLSLASDRHDGKGQFVESSDHTARIWNAAAGAELVRFHTDGALVARWLPDGRRICTGVRIWNLPERLD